MLNETLKGLLLMFTGAFALGEIPLAPIAAHPDVRAKVLLYQLGKAGAYPRKLDLPLMLFGALAFGLDDGVVKTGCLKRNPKSAGLSIWEGHAHLCVIPPVASHHTPHFAIA